MDELRILSTTAILGYGFPLASFEEGMRRRPHVIAADAGSTDPGPYYLGAGVSFTDRAAVKRDLELMLSAGAEANIPVVVGSAGGSGAAPHLKWCVDIVKEIAREKGLRFKLAVIPADVDKDAVRSAMKAGRLRPLEPAPALTEADLDATARVVAQMGAEPIVQALEQGADIVIAGRAYDPAVFSAVALQKGYDRALATHLGKILECAAIAATPGSGSDCMFGWLGSDYFRVEPLNPIRKCTELSVAAHTLYEKTNPYVLPGPGGALDLTRTSFEQTTDRAVTVRGSRFVPTEKYALKLEGAKRIGYRTVSIAGARDPVMIAKMDDIVAGVRERVADNFKGREMKYFLDFKVYGRNGVMGALEPVQSTRSHEIGIVIEAVADTQADANTVCGFARSTMLHYGYEGRVSTAGNLAFPYSPSDFKAGEVFVFSVYHLMEIEDPLALFPVNMESL
jgi:hypothetical protein